MAVTRADGSYQLTTYLPEDGGPQGEYVVTIIWPDDSVPIDECKGEELLLAHDRFRGLFANRASSSLRATVRPNADEIPFQVQDKDGLFGRRGATPSP